MKKDGIRVDRRMREQCLEVGLQVLGGFKVLIWGFEALDSFFDPLQDVCEVLPDPPPDQPLLTSESG